MLWIVFIIATVSCASAITKEDCPETIPKDKYTQVHGDVCYRFELDIKKEYDDAREYCLRRGGNLVTVKSKVINDFIIDALKNQLDYHEVAWIGLNDKQDEEHFVWEDGTPMAYNNFASASGIKHFFRHAIEDCVGIDVDTGLWHDYKCSDYFLHIVNEHKRFICEFHVDVPDTTTTTTSTRTTFKPTTMTTARTTVCPELVCNLDCGMDGFKWNAKGCTICQCDSDGDDSLPVVTSTLPTTHTKADATTKPSTTATPKPSTTTTAPCKELLCNLDCSRLGFERDAVGCVMCRCKGSS